MDKNLPGGTVKKPKIMDGARGAGASATVSAASTQQSSAPSVMVGGTLAVPAPAFPFPSWMYASQAQAQGGVAPLTNTLPGSGPILLGPPPAPPPPYQPLAATGQGFAPGFGVAGGGGYSTLQVAGPGAAPPPPAPAPQPGRARISGGAQGGGCRAGRCQPGTYYETASVGGNYRLESGGVGLCASRKEHLRTLPRGQTREVGMPQEVCSGVGRAVSGLRRSGDAGTWGLV